MSGIDLMGDLPFAPQANPEVVRRLKEIDPSLGMRYVPIGSGSWAITEKWSEFDPRRSSIQSGFISPDMDFDIIGFAPEEAGLEDAMGMLLQKLRSKAKDNPEKYGSMLDNLVMQNKLQMDANLESVREFARELFDANEENFGTKVVSRGAGFNIEDGKVVGTPYEPKRGLTKSERDARIEMSDQ